MNIDNKLDTVGDFIKFNPFITWLILMGIMVISFLVPIIGAILGVLVLMPLIYAYFQIGKAAVEIVEKDNHDKNTFTK